MAALTPEIKTFIVQALACFDSPSQVAEAVRANFGVTVSRQQVEAHDPTKRCSKGLAKRWVTLFEDTRAGFRETMIEVPVANRAYRLRALGRMLEEAEERGHIAQALKLLEQAAKECGDMYTVRRTSGAGSSEELATRIAVEFSIAPGSPISLNAPIRS
ncbi:DUF2280 domain-containing protein [Pseudomonas amygdali pv. lachrymans]|uniref:DUF2280 domain-containing protein n=2 Tax=Pseudomonas amygdali pv. lachrymans TaxID=53707 RepID=A0ABR5KNY0_PSEAV|nr:DUF2280 domain-containing protein [Pseudomonas amygdali]AXH57279.1 DUF2280 domain-containing protein [Pseudomonas amygdali pv. lachrymans str. M301315]KPC16357.1 Uncharacterized protein AC499_6692 [Pseudomonas amygdali pv. lachrymans]PWD02951.1 DUF2280 domain-containing protein [Pseudomonas amygdali pv. lachrymans]QWA51674.1 DUF2280 domain-containing protein [Pseudomonas amygdali pv. lachrymans]RMT08142.1 hypothetical protein ALP54_01277 [Pseudomonas amygdali pv. lachrymans]